MFEIFTLISSQDVVFAVLVTFIASFVKGAIGFAMPMIMVSGMASFLPAEIALAALILPTLIANLQQTLREGPAEALRAMRGYWRYVAIVLVTIAFSAQLVTALPRWVFYICLGGPVTALALLQLIGWRPHIAAQNRARADWAVGVTSGLMGGLSGVWGPTTVLYLTALEVPKALSVKIQGVIYGAGAVVLTLAHLRSGILNSATVPFSALLILPAVFAMWVGFQVQDRLDQARFRRWTLVVLVIAGLNLIRRGVMAF
ncbi:MAG: sulfite exporter TauE/SafE family protein [Mangrovicoccus sp.]|nr:sulfite exporter TauE/SafE family protein [Mangrovicoccus sp.]